VVWLIISGWSSGGLVVRTKSLEAGSSFNPVTRRHESVLSFLDSKLTSQSKDRYKKRQTGQAFCSASN
jgi:hypothetical protein